MGMYNNNLGRGIINTRMRMYNNSQGRGTINTRMLNGYLCIKKVAHDMKSIMLYSHKTGVYTTV